MQSHDQIPAKGPAAPADLVASIAASLREAKDRDVALLDILSKNILVMNPANTAVADALTDIEKLASKRAERADNGQTDHP
jgi:hypothetical protein